MLITILTYTCAGAYNGERERERQKQTSCYTTTTVYTLYKL